MIPDFVYKFTDAKWASQMVKFGRLRIGTLHDYWHSCYPEGIRDDREGKILQYRVIQYEPGDPIPPQWGTEFFSINPRSNARIADCSARTSGISVIPNMYVYCTTTRYDESFFDKFGRHYNTCVRIGPMDQFISALGGIFGREFKVHTMLSSNCRYGVREITYNRGTINTHPAFLKEAIYSDQEEFRIIGETKLRGIRPRDIRLKDSINLFSVYHQI